MFVRDWMTDQVMSALPNTPISGALGMMNERKVRRLPVVEGPKLVGIVTKSDIYARIGMKSDEDPTVAEIMTRNPITVASTEQLENAALIMHEKRISGLPVVDKKKLVGIITETDIFRAFVDIMGIREKGVRIMLSFKSGDKLLSQIRNRIGRMAVRSLVTYHDPNKDEWVAVLRVRGHEDRTTIRRRI